MNVFDKLRGLGRTGAPRTDHPLANPRELRRAIDEIPRDDSLRAVDDIIGWMESLQGAEGFPAPALFEALAGLEEVAQQHLRRLARNYLQTPRLSRAEEQRLRGLSSGFWELLAAGYERCLADGAGLNAKTVAEVSVRLLVALGQSLKWQSFQHVLADGRLWGRMGAALLAAEAAGAGERSVSLPGSAGGPTSARREYTRRVAFEAATLDSLQPLQIELAERLIGHVLPAFILTEKAEADSVYWVDLSLPVVPKRMADMPERPAAGQRFFRPGDAHAALGALLHDLERGHDVPPEINLGGQYPAQVLVPVLRHLAQYLAPVPPQRRFPRHGVRQRAGVVHGMEAVSALFFPGVQAQPATVPADTWLVENVSRGGLGARVEAAPGDWLRAGVLLAIQPEGGNNWLICVVRRYRRQAGGTARVGIETLARHPVPAELRVLTSSSYVMADGLPVLLVREDCEPGEWRALLPAGSFNLRNDMECIVEGRRVVLHPVALADGGPGWELARYHLPQGA